MKKLLFIFVIVSIISTALIACSKPDIQNQTTTQALSTTVSVETTVETTTEEITSTTTKKETTAPSTTKKHTTTKKKTTTKKYDYAKDMNITLSKKGKEIIKQVGGMSFNEVMEDVSNFKSFKIADEENPSISYSDKTKSGIKAEITCNKNGDDSNDIIIKTSKYEFHYYSVFNGDKQSNRAIYIVIKNAKNRTHVAYSNSQEKVVLEEAIYKSNGGYMFYNSYLQDGKLVEFEEEYDIDNPPICD